MDAQQGRCLPRPRRRHRRRRAALHRHAHERRRRADDRPRVRRRGGRRPGGRRSSTRAVDRYHEAGAPGPGHRAIFLGRALSRGAPHRCKRPRSASRSRPSVRPRRGRAGRRRRERRSRPRRAPALAPHRPRARRRARRCRRAVTPGATPLKYVIVATGNIYDDAVQAKAAAHAGADIVAVIRATAQSLLDYVPHGATTEGYGGTFATQENFRIIRRATDEATHRVRSLHPADELLVRASAWRRSPGWRPSSGSTCCSTTRCTGSSSATSTCAAPSSTSTSSRRFIARARDRHQHRRGQLPDDRRRRREGPHRPREPVHQRGVRQARRPARGADGARTRIRDQPVDRGQLPARARAGAADSADLPAAPDQVDAARPSTRRATSSSPTCTTRCSTWSASTTHQSIELLGMFSEAIHNPLLMDRYLSLKATRYVHGAARAPGRRDQLQAGRHRRATRRAGARRGARAARGGQGAESIWEAIGRGAFADVKRTTDGRQGYAGVVERARGLREPDPGGARGEGLTGSVASRGRRRARTRACAMSPACIRRPPASRCAPTATARRRHGADVVRPRSFPPGARAREAAKRFAEPTACRPLVATMEAVRRGLPFFVVYGHSQHAVDSAQIDVPEVRTEALSREEIEHRIKTRLGRKIVVVGACTGQRRAHGRHRRDPELQGLRGRQGPRELQGLRGVQPRRPGRERPARRAGPRARRRRHPREPGHHPAQLPQGERRARSSSCSSAGLAERASSCSSAARASTTSSPSSSASTRGSARAPSRATWRRTWSTGSAATRARLPGPDPWRARSAAGRCPTVRSSGGGAAPPSRAAGPLRPGRAPAMSRPDAATRCAGSPGSRAAARSPSSEFVAPSPAPTAPTTAPASATTRPCDGAPRCSPRRGSGAGTTVVRVAAGSSPLGRRPPGTRTRRPSPLARRHTRIFAVA